MTASNAFAAIDRVLRQPERTIWLATAAHQQARSGLVATWVASASIDPAAPLVAVGLAPNHQTAKLAYLNGAFGLHLVDESHLEIIWRFCLHSGDVYDKFSGVSHRIGLTGSPLLSHCLAALDCQTIDVWDVGDRLFFLAEPIEAQEVAAGSPLTESQLLALASPEQRQILSQRMAQDVTIQRPLRQAWRDRISRQASPQVRGPK